MLHVHVWSVVGATCTCVECSGVVGATCTCVECSGCYMYMYMFRMSWV